MDVHGIVLNSKGKSDFCLAESKMEGIQAEGAAPKKKNDFWGRL